MTYYQPQNADPKLVIAALTAFVALTFAPAMAHDNRISVEVKNGERCFSGNGLPDHATGQFPNKGNPNAIAAKTLSVCLTTNPTKNAKPRFIQGPIGIGINGVEFRPGTADWYDPDARRKFSRDKSSGWKMEGLNPDNILGMDSQNAHVGPDGLYHYHGVANALVKSAGNGPIGYAADGFPIVYGGSEKPSYQLKSGNRPSGGSNPGGRYDGTYVQDYDYVAGSGTLDQCNGRVLNGTYTYFATENYPYLPRCLWGTVSADLKVQMREGRNRNGQRERRRAGRDGQRPRQGGGNRRQPPQIAVNACLRTAESRSCSFKAPRRNRTVNGTCRVTRSGTKACVPARRG